MTRHPRDLVSLFFGLVFILSGVVFLNQTEQWFDLDAASLLAIGVIGLGSVGAILVFVGYRRDRPVAAPTTSGSDHGTDPLVEGGDAGLVIDPGSKDQADPT